MNIVLYYFIPSFSLPTFLFLISFYLSFFAFDCLFVSFLTRPFFLSFWFIPFFFLFFSHCFAFIPFRFSFFCILSLSLSSSLSLALSLSFLKLLSSYALLIPHFLNLIPNHNFLLSRSLSLSFSRVPLPQPNFQTPTSSVNVLPSQVDSILIKSDINPCPPREVSSSKL